MIPHNKTICFLPLLLILLLTNCTKEETPEYEKILSEYKGSYYIYGMFWEPHDKEDPEVVDINQDGVLSNELLGEILYLRPPEGWLKSSFESDTGDRRGILRVYIPMFNCYLHNGDVSYHGVENILSFELPMTVYTDSSIHWGHFTAFSEIQEENVGLNTFADVSVESYRPNRIVLSVGHYYVYDFKTDNGYDGTLKVHLAKSESDE